MTCMHGLDDINCPICRIDLSTIPIKSIKINDLHQNDLKPYYHASKKKENLLNVIAPKMNPHKTLSVGNGIDAIPEARTLNKLPEFKNKMFLERLSELNLDKSETISFLKKVSLENPEWTFKEE